MHLTLYKQTQSVLKYLLTDFSYPQSFKSYSTFVPLWQMYLISAELQ